MTDYRTESRKQKNSLEHEVSLGEDVTADELGDALGEPGGGEEPLPDAVVVLDAELDALHSFPLREYDAFEDASDED